MIPQHTKFRKRKIFEIFDVILILLQACTSLFPNLRSYLLHTRRSVLCCLVILLYCLCLYIQTQEGNRDAFLNITVVLRFNVRLSPRLLDIDHCESLVLKRYPRGFLEKKRFFSRVEVVSRIMLNGATIC